MVDVVVVYQISKVRYIVRDIDRQVDHTFIKGSEGQRERDEMK